MAITQEQLKDFLPILKMLPAGYYAVRRETVNETLGEIDFFRVSYPKTRWYEGAMKVQSQHGENLMLELAIFPNRVEMPRHTSQDFAGLIFEVLNNPIPAAQLYAKEKGICCICAKELTVERSRYYGIGPDCEGRHQDIIDWVDGRTGVYYEGITLDLEKANG